MKKVVLYLLIISFFTVAIPYICIFPNSVKKIKIYDTKGIFKMDLEDYIACVVAAEMPSCFEEEALKAQSVATRTYTLEKMKNSNNIPQHHGAHVCTDSTHCQAFSDIRSKKDKNTEKIRRAVSSTKWQILTYNSAPIKAVYHACSHGATENVQDVWGSDLPYLKSVDSPYDSICPDYETKCVFDVAALCQILSVKEFALGEIIRSDAGGVKTIQVGDTVFKGTEIRNKLGLKSTCFSIEVQKNTVTFSVKGYGHGVGLSQWGAEGMARHGADYIKILKHYYSGVEISRIQHR